MSKLTIDVPVELKAILEAHPGFYWERVAEGGLWSYARKVQLADQLASRSTLTEAAGEAIGREVKRGLRRCYSKAAR